MPVFSTFALQSLKDQAKALMASIDDDLAFRHLQQGENRALVTELIHEILAEPSWVHLISKKSYIHDNGFVKLVVEQENSFVSETRLHIWPSVPAPGIDYGNIHNHSAHFAALVVRGALKEEIFENIGENFIMPPVKVKEYFCGSRGEQDHYEMKFQRNTELSLALSETVSEGNWHILGNRVLHRAYPAVAPTVTMFFQSPRKSYGTNVYCALEKNWNDVVPSQALQPADVIFWLQKTITLLNN